MEAARDVPQKATIGLKFYRKGWHKKIIKHSNHPKAADFKVTIRKLPTWMRKEIRKILEMTLSKKKRR